MSLGRSREFFARTCCSDGLYQLCHTARSCGRLSLVETHDFMTNPTPMLTIDLSLEIQSDESCSAATWLPDSDWMS